ncbi:hypothetical protein [Variovorax sp. PCZ-1]|uniref:hypothetical protein n=1 Tax=Variovorax sp. PCZ-1 TaxID=2835533 RepID=UPI001BCFABB4|nr:hypothetical protein [Variovorax sp. PCZ-1]MBS7807351.1 hypothetical protein [Variovorax sp. PCZ-1]
MSDEILIALAGLLLSVLTYFAGIWRAERHHRTQDSEARITRVFQKYMEFRRSNYTGGYDGAQKAGIATLESNEEIHTFATLVVGHGELHPLGSDHATVFASVDLLKFFRYAATNRVNFLTTPIESAIADSGARS